MMILFFFLEFKITIFYVRSQTHAPNNIALEKDNKKNMLKHESTSALVKVTCVCQCFCMYGHWGAIWLSAFLFHMC